MIQNDITGEFGSPVNGLDENKNQERENVTKKLHSNQKSASDHKTSRVGFERGRTGFMWIAKESLRPSVERASAHFCVKNIVWYDCVKTGIFWL